MKFFLGAFLSAVAVSAFAPHRLPVLRTAALNSHTLEGFCPVGSLPPSSSYALPSPSRADAAVAFSSFNQAYETPADPNPPCLFATHTVSAAAPSAAAEPSFPGFTQAYETPHDPNPPFFSTQIGGASKPATSFSAYKQPSESFSDPNPPLFSTQTATAAAPAAASKPATAFKGYTQACESSSDPNPPDLFGKTPNSAKPQGFYLDPMYMT